MPADRASSTSKSPSFVAVCGTARQTQRGGFGTSPTNRHPPSAASPARAMRASMLFLFPTGARERSRSAALEQELDHVAVAELAVRRSSRLTRRRACPGPIPQEPRAAVEVVLQHGRLG